MLEDAARCSMCGTAEWEWNPREGGQLDAYVAMWHDCMGCKHKDAFRSGEGEQNVAGRSVVLKSREEADRIRLNPAAQAGPPRMERRTRAKRSGG